MCRCGSDVLAQGCCVGQRRDNGAAEAVGKELSSGSKNKSKQDTMTSSQQQRSTAALLTAFELSNRV